MAPEKVQEKFRSLADPVIGPEKALAVIDAVTEVRELSDIREVTRLLVPTGSAQGRLLSSNPNGR